MTEQELNTFRDHLAQHHDAKYEFLIKDEATLTEWHKRDHEVFPFGHTVDQVIPYK